MNDATDIAQSLISQPMMAAAVVAVGVMAILKMVNELVRLRDNLRQKPEPQAVKDEAIAATAQVAQRVVKVESISQDLSRCLDRHESDICSLRTHERECAARVHARIDEIATVVNHTNGKVEEGMKHVTESLKEIRLIVLTKKEKP
jgi:hypothetical protein